MSHTKIKPIDIQVNIHITASVICGIIVLATGIVALFVISDPAQAVTLSSVCITTGSALVGAAKICNTYVDTQKIALNRPVKQITRKEYDTLPIEERLRDDITWNITD